MIRIMTHFGKQNKIFVKDIVNFVLKRKLVTWYLLNECEDLYEEMQLYMW
jgi:hypothetical protein